MKNKPLVIVIALVLFCFAGYNLYTYFEEQKLIAIEQEKQVKLAEQKRLAKLQALAQKKETERLAKLEAARLVEEQKKQAEEHARLETARKAEEQRQAELEKQRLAEEAKIEERRRIARTPVHIEGIRDEIIETMLAVSPRYIRDHREEVIGESFDAHSFGRDTSRRMLITDGTNTLMLYAAFTKNIEHLKALIDIGIDVNSTNKKGFTPLMFASAYNSPDVIEFLISQGADTSIKAYLADMTPLHVAAYLNPNPEAVKHLVNAGLDLESVTTNGFTPLLLAASYNQNIEVVATLADLGADIEAYDSEGLTAYGAISRRIENNTETHQNSISEMVLSALMKRQ